jgi:hypothetical protein
VFVQSVRFAEKSPCAIAYDGVADLATGHHAERAPSRSRRLRCVLQNVQNREFSFRSASLFVNAAKLVIPLEAFAFRQCAASIQQNLWRAWARPTLATDACAPCGGGGAGCRGRSCCACASGIRIGVVAWFLTVDRFFSWSWPRNLRGRLFQERRILAARLRLSRRADFHVLHDYHCERGALALREANWAETRCRRGQQTTRNCPTPFSSAARWIGHRARIAPCKSPRCPCSAIQSRVSDPPNQASSPPGCGCTFTQRQAVARVGCAGCSASRTLNAPSAQPSTATPSPISSPASV